MEVLEEIKFDILPFHSSLVKDYLAEKKELKPFYSYPPRMQGLTEALSRRQFSSEQRATLTDALVRQYGILLDREDSQDIKEVIEKFRDPHTFTVTTGHQLSVYTGPAYFIYKIASVINLAKNLQASGENCTIIPVFWMASEDHDFDEIAEVSFYGKSWHWEKETGKEGRVPTGHLNPNSIAVWAEEMKAYFRDTAELNGLISVMEDAYRNKANLAHATREIVHFLFKSYGLVVIDGDDPELKTLFRPVILTELQGMQTENAIRQSSDKLKKMGYDTQVNGRPCNLFYFSDEGNRDRLDRQQDKFITATDPAEYGLETLKHEAEKQPWRFSPNVVLRPLYQEMVLPNLAYIGGPAEVAYWLQLKDMFESHAVQFPVILSRSSFVAIPDHIHAIIQKYNFSITDYLVKSLDTLLDEFITRSSGEEYHFEKEEHVLSDVASQIKKKAESLDKQLAVQVDIEEKSWMDSMKKLRSKFNKALKMRSDADMKQLQKVRNCFFPAGTFQERRISFLEISAMTGLDIKRTIYLADCLGNTLRVVKK
jgi:bacillithiol biosynthesis cysteine-adding enzyme BshC